MSRFKVTKDLVVVSIFMLLLAVMNVTAIIYNRNAEVSQAYLNELMRSTGVCTLRSSGAVNTEEIPFTPEAIEDYYNLCLEERTGE